MKVFGSALRPLTQIEVDELRRYAAKYGRTWKSHLRDEWMRASTIGPLQALRNSHGPSWLVRFRFNDLPAHMLFPQKEAQPAIGGAALHAVQAQPVVSAEEYAGRSVQLTPDFARMFQTFVREIDCKVTGFDTTLLASAFPDVEYNDLERDTVASMLQQVHQLLVPINIALQCATTVAAVKELREAVSAAVEKLAALQAKWEAPDPRIPRCDSCQMMNIQGVNTHEHGCPNAGKTWMPDEETWVTFIECRECGCDIRFGEECNCQTPEVE